MNIHKHPIIIFFLGAVRLFANKKSKSIHAHLCKTSKLVLVAVISQMI